MRSTDGADRYRAHREAGWSPVRADGSLFSPDTDREAKSAETWCAHRHGAEGDDRVFGEWGDDGYDFPLRVGDSVALVDVYWLGRWPNGTLRKRDGQHLVKNLFQRHWADLFVVVSGSATEGYDEEGWCSVFELWSQPKKNFGYGDRFAMPVEKLHDDPPPEKVVAALEERRSTGEPRPPLDPP